ncbi:hypothetical protein [Oscillatoria acuminata]|nr:hypothetical protein [Oscillatoria acuminata]
MPVCALGAVIGHWSLVIGYWLSRVEKGDRLIITGRRSPVMSPKN